MGTNNVYNATFSIDLGRATFFMVKEATSVFPVVAFLAIRFGLACAALVPFMLRRPRWPTRLEWRWGVIAATSITAN